MPWLVCAFLLWLFQPYWELNNSTYETHEFICPKWQEPWVSCIRSLFLENSKITAVIGTLVLFVLARLYSGCIILALCFYSLCVQMRAHVYTGSQGYASCLLRTHDLQLRRQCSMALLGATASLTLYLLHRKPCLNDLVHLCKAEMMSLSLSSLLVQNIWHLQIKVEKLYSGSCFRNFSPSIVGSMMQGSQQRKTVHFMVDNNQSGRRIWGQRYTLLGHAHSDPPLSMSLHLPTLLPAPNPSAD